MTRLLAFLREHRGAVEYDFRHRFGIGVRDIPHHMTLLEAGRLLAVIVDDPGSATCAAVNGWDVPLSREGWLLAELFDFEQLRDWVDRGKKGARPKPHPFRDSSVTEPKPNRIKIGKGGVSPRDLFGSGRVLA